MAVIAYHVAAVYIFHRGLTDTASQSPSFWLNKLFAAGHNGVALFFAISGFILSVPFARERLHNVRPVRLREYYWRRVTRIEPPYIIQLFAMLLLCIFVFRKLPSHPELYSNPGWLSYTLSHIGTSFFYSHSMVFGEHAYPNYVLWSLEVEVQFYIIAPLLARMLFFRHRTGRRLLLCFLILGGIALAFIFGQHYRFWASILGNLHFFLLGFLFADLFVESELQLVNGRLGWDLAGFVSGLFVVFVEQHPVNTVAVPLAILFCFFAAFRGVVMPRVLQNPWIITIGGMCYTIYMYHAVGISVLIRATEKVRFTNFSLDLFVQFSLLILVILPTCAVLFVLLERPFMDRNWPAKLRQAFRKPKPATANHELVVR
jgi:peptidoglycan/LPS O-acetylase OafA/YrhL